MTTKKRYLATLVTLAVLAPMAAAQGQTTTTTTSTSTMPNSFESLSPGNQKIAQALFNAQHPTASGPAPLDLNQIATLKAGTGWGGVFQKMRSEGLITDKNLGQVVSGYEHTLTHSTTFGAGTTGSAVTVTNGMGHANTTGPEHSNGIGAEAHGNSGTSHGESTAITTAGGSSVAGVGAINAGGNGLHTGEGMSEGHSH